jgi:[protein-PII] uridylyltransferase
MSSRARPNAVVRLFEELSALERAYTPGHHGRWSAGRRAALVDACVVDLVGELPSGVALVALGGYGRRRLSPRSDLDVLLAHDGVSADAITAISERVLYPLWDAGFRVGHGVRTPDESVELAAEHLDARTAMLDGRVLAGDGDVWTRSLTPVLAAVRGDVERFAQELADDADARRERSGSVSYLLEPDLKEGAGGLRDVQLVHWLEVAVGAPLERTGVIREAERRALEEADEFLERVRGALQLETGRDGDRLVLEQQPPLARDLGFSDEPSISAVDALMRAVFEHARHVEHASRSVLERVRRRDVSVDARPPVERLDAVGVLRVLRAAATGDGVGSLPPVTLDRIEAADVPEDVAWDDAIRDAFLELVRAPDAVGALEALDRLGLLSRYLPAWREVRCRPQRDPYHRFSVDMHLLTALGEMQRLLAGEDEDPLVGRSVELVEDVDGALLGALFHDIGKTGRGSHVAEGSRIAEASLAAMRVDEATASLASFLVREHLLLSDTATRRDLDDEELIHDVAARVGARGRLAALTLLTLADAAATGPLAWTAWRATLVRELVSKVSRALERGDVGADAAERLAARADEIRAALAGEEERRVDRFLLRMPRTYLLNVPVERIASQYPLIATPLQAHEVRTQAAEGERAGTYALTVVTSDRPALLSSIAGSLSLAGLSILTAQVFTTEDGVAVDLFEVAGAFEAGIGEERWREFRSTLRRAVEGRLSLTYRVAEKRRRYPPGRHVVPLRVEVDNGASDFFTIVEVSAPDRIGLLFDITRTLSELQLDVHLAKVATYGERVVDAFYVRDALGRKVDDAERLEELERALRASLAD